MEYDAETIWSFILVLTAALAYRYVPRWRAKSPFIEPKVMKQRLDAGEDVVVVDVRTRAQFAGGAGHIPGSVNVPLSDLAARLEARDRDLSMLKDHPVFVHCAGELQASRAARVLRDAGFSDVSVLMGGIRAWRRRGYPVEKD